MDVTTANYIFAELIPDQGECALSNDFFRSRCYFDAEAVSHSLILRNADGPILTIPLIVRDIPGTTLQDAITPYGFPGGRALRPVLFSSQDVVWKDVNLVSIFIRDRLNGPPIFRDGTVRGMVQAVDKTLPLRIRRNHRCNIRANEARGYTTQCIPAHSATREDRDAFHSMYLRTMERHHARSRYCFSDRYMAKLFESDLSWLVQTSNRDLQPVAGIIVVQSDGLLHCHLSGSADDFHHEAPTKNAFLGAIEFAASKRMCLNLGGGRCSPDSLEHFKKGFANATLPFHTHEIICQADTYHQLTLGKEGSGFFPVYRSDSD